MDQGLLTTLGRRSAQRICLRADVGILDEATGERTLGKLRDLSGTGASMLTSEELKVGKELRLAFEYRSIDPPIRLHAAVAWSGRRSTGHATGVLSGVRFLDLAGSDFGRLRKFIDDKLWTVQHFLSSMELLADLNDLEKLLFSSVAFDRELKQGESLDDGLAEDALIIARSGTLLCHEYDRAGRAHKPRKLVPGEMCGTLPVDPRGGSHVRVRAVTDAAALVIPSDGFWYLWNTHADTALKLISCWCVSLRDRVFTHEPVE